MAQPPDESKSKTLLDPELNPILNPLLAAHMGRWAEVYFTSPPEKREQAVADLLRELARDAGTSEAIAESGGRRGPAHEFEEHAPADEPEDHKAEEEYPVTGMEQREPMREIDIESNSSSSLLEAIGDAFSVCKSCGHINVGGQKFCGMCGKSLANGASRSAQQFGDRDAEHRAPKDQVAAPRFWDDDRSIAESRGTKPVDPSVSPSAAASSENAVPAENFDDSYEDDSYGNEEAAFESRQDFERRTEIAEPPVEFSLRGYEQEPPARSYRLYIALVVIVLLAVLVYTTWRSNAGSNGSALAPEMPAAAPYSSPPAAVSSPSNGAPNAATEQASPQPSSSEASGNEPAPNHDISAKNPHPPKAEPIRQKATASTATPPSASAAGQSGSEELATAERYLRAGPSGTQQAVPWLWKAMAKQNAAATLMLSDLYLRGEGVPKNCDQARLLLDAAARKGEPAAAERLRSLPSYGCQ